MSNTHQALIIIDMQQGMLPSANPARNNPQAESNMLRLLDYWRQLKWPVVHVKHRSNNPLSPFWPKQRGFEWQAPFSPQAHEQIIEKDVPDAFLLTPLAQWLREQAVRHLIIIGVSTNISVESSARTASNLGFKVSVVSDATFAFKKIDYTGRHHSADTVHHLSLANLVGEFADSVTTQGLLSSLKNLR